MFVCFKGQTKEEMVRKEVEKSAGEDIQVLRDFGLYELMLSLNKYGEMLIES